MVPGVSAEITTVSQPGDVLTIPAGTYRGMPAIQTVSVRALWIEASLEQLDQQRCHSWVLCQRLLDVTLTEGGPGLPQVLGVGPQHHGLSPVQAGSALPDQ